MTTMQDHRALTRLGALLTATTDFSTLTNDPQARNTVQWLRQACGGARTSLEHATTSLDREGTQLQQAIAKADLSVAEAANEYAAVIASMRYHWLPTRQADRQQLGDNEWLRRTDWLERHTAHTGRDLQRQGRQSVLTYLRGMLNATAHPDMADLMALLPEGIDALQDRVEVLDGALQEIEKERLDDAPVYDALIHARQQATTVYSAARNLLEGALALVGSPLTAKAFVLREVTRRAPDQAAEVQAALSSDGLTDPTTPADAPTSPSAVEAMPAMNPAA